MPSKTFNKENAGQQNSPITTPERLARCSIVKWWAVIGGFRSIMND